MHSGKAESRQDASESAAEYVVVLAVEVVTRAAESAGENLFLVPHTACDGQELRGARVAVGSSNRITASYGIFSVSIDPSLAIRDDLPTGAEVSPTFWRRRRGCRKWGETPRPLANDASDVGRRLQRSRILRHSDRTVRQRRRRPTVRLARTICANSSKGPKFPGRTSVATVVGRCGPKPPRLFSAATARRPSPREGSSQ